MPAFGKSAGSAGGSRSKAAKRAGKARKTEAPRKADGAAEPRAEASTPEPKSVFKRDGDPFLVATAAEPQQTPAPRPTPPPASPAQRDATRPPGTEQRSPVPPQSRLNVQDPTAPPGTQRTAPAQPPGTQIEQPAAPRTPTTTTTTTDPAQTQSTDPLAPATEELQEPEFPAVQPRPVPPMPSLARVGVVSGDTLPLTLNEAVRRALENNNDIEFARADVRLNEQTLLALEGVYDPVFTYRPEYNSSVRPVPNIFGGAGASGTVSTTDYNNDVSITRQFGRGGGNYSYFFNNTRENTTSGASTLNPLFSSAQGVNFTQPLWRNRSIDRNRREIRVQRKRLEQSDADFRRRTIEVISQVQRAYWDLVFALREEQNQIANLNLTRENFRRTEASVAAGAVAPLERSEVQTELSNRESALLVATQNVTIAENNLKNLLLKDPLSPDWSKVIVPTDTPTFDEAPLNLESALKEARANRPELRRLNLQEEISDIDIQYFKNQTKPQIDLTGTFSTTGLAGTPAAATTTAGPLIPDPEVAQNRNASSFLLAEINRLRALRGEGPAQVPTVTVTEGGNVPS
ncbi:MAG TPA: TolC family protein, partial [Pyrinomonadaceae bacterium]|nr:TolC family protein [Pyrinomonadaceae bacterium]